MYLLQTVKNPGTLLNSPYLKNRRGLWLARNNILIILSGELSESVARWIDNAVSEWVVAPLMHYKYY